jgi:hypothetical protein
VAYRRPRPRRPGVSRDDARSQDTRRSGAGIGASRRDTLLNADTEPGQWHAKFRSRRRDPVRADRDETESRRLFHGHADIGGSNPLDFRHAATACEVSGAYQDDQPLEQGAQVKKDAQSERLTAASTRGVSTIARASYSAALGRPTVLNRYRRR